MKKTTFLALVLAFAMTGLTACYGADDSAQIGSGGSVTATDSDLATDTESDITTDNGTDAESDTGSDTGNEDVGDTGESNTSSDENSEEKEVYYTVTFYTDGAGDIDPIRVLAGERIDEPETPNKTTTECEYTFLGWYCGEGKWDFQEDVVTSDVTLVAHWQEGNKYSNPFLPKD